MRKKLLAFSRKGKSIVSFCFRFKIVRIVCSLFALFQKAIGVVLLIVGFTMGMSIVIFFLHKYTHLRPTVTDASTFLQICQGVVIALFAWVPAILIIIAACMAPGLGLLFTARD